MPKKSTKSKKSVGGTFADFIDERVEQLKTLFPEVVSDGNLDRGKEVRATRLYLLLETYSMRNG